MEDTNTQTPEQTPTVEILSALYGTEEKTVDVTPNIFKNIGKKVTNRTTGIDPCPGKKKKLTVKFIINGSESEKIFNEGEKLIF